jgi:hypothetical protein
VYGYVFNNMHKTVTLLNCCDEGNTYLPIFNGNSGAVTMLD